MLKRFIYFFFGEIALLGVGLLTFPEWIRHNPGTVILIGVIPLLFLFVWDHLPDAMLSWQKSRWCNIEQGRQIFRDEITKLGDEEVAAEIDVISDHMDASAGKAAAAQKYIRFGIQNGIIKARGVPEHGLEEVVIDPEIATRDEYLQKYPLDAIVSRHGVLYTNVRLFKSGIRNTAQVVATHSARSKTSPGVQD